VVGLILSAAEPADVCLRAIPSEHDPAADHAGFLDIVTTNRESPFERLLDRDATLLSATFAHFSTAGASPACRSAVSPSACCCLLAKMHRHRHEALCL
jgi:hypothetical protein